MDCKSVGSTIAALRKKLNMTQEDLANRLGISNKAVSKWESGQGYPDITMFPQLALLLNVSIDYLMLGEKRGITIAGNILADIVKNIDVYPETGMLAEISDIVYAVGGCVPNTAIDLAKIDRSIPVEAIGKIGNDESGRFILSQLQQNGVKTEKIKFSQKNQTSFTDVMSLPSGERTLFYKKGANAEFSPEDIDIDSLECDLFHIGYILLLDMFDSCDETYGTVMARFLHDVQQKGIKTSIDVVSSSTDDYAKKIIPALRYCNYAIMNETESCSIWNIEPYTADGKINAENIETAMRKMAECGVKDKIIIHCKTAAFIMDVQSGEISYMPSLKIPKDEIKGSVGAGDAFCAGSLYGIYNGYSDTHILEFASAAAACSLFEANSVDGMKSKNEILKIAEKYERL